MTRAKRTTEKEKEAERDGGLRLPLRPGPGKASGKVITERGACRKQWRGLCKPLGGEGSEQQEQRPWDT